MNQPELSNPPCPCADCNNWVAEDEPFLRMGWHGKVVCLPCGTHLGLGAPTEAPAKMQAK